MAIKPDRKNANKGTERGRYMVEASLRETGAGRSILLDSNDQIIAGNKTFEAATDIGLPVRVIETDGTELIAVKRTDLDLDDDTGMARKMAYYDNRAGQVGLEWDVEVVLSDIGAGLDLSGLFFKDELDELLAGLNPLEDTEQPYSREIKSPVYKVKGVKPAVSELFDDSKTKALIAAIQADGALSDDEKAFLSIAAQRHTVLKFNRIADFYAHSDAPVQAHMEDSALVIIDFNRAIELGYVELTKNIADLVREEYGE